MLNLKLVERVQKGEADVLHPDWQEREVGRLAGVHHQGEGGDTAS